MDQAAKVVHTARTRTTGAREHGISRSSDGRLDVRFSIPHSGGFGTSPEHLFAAAWSGCFETAIALVADKRKIALPGAMTIDAEVSLNELRGAYFLSARLDVGLPGIERGIAQTLINEAHEICPYSKATRGNIEVVIKLV